jgi:hypothetical protein
MTVLLDWRMLVWIRRLVLFAAVVVPMLCWTAPSFAAITPVYHTCDGYQIYNKGFATGACSGNWKITNVPASTDRNANPSMSTFIGYVYDTPEPGTQPMWFVCVKVVPHPPKGGTPPPPFCGGDYSISSSPNTDNFYQFIGYVYTTQVPDTTPSYFGCHVGTPSKAGVFCAGANSYGFFPEPLHHPNLNWFLGYVYQIPPVSTYIFSPKFFIGSVIYVPPGQGPSTITYGAGTVTGTTVSSTDSWSNSTTLDVTADKFKIKGIGDVGISYSWTWTEGQSETDTLEVVRTESQSTVYRGPASNIINHDYDQVVIYLGVKLVATQDYLQNIQWALDFSDVLNQGYARDGYAITVGCLRPNSTIPPALCTPTIDFLNSVDITPADYPAILGANPFSDPAAAPPVPDPLRYVLIDSVKFFPDPTSSVKTATITNSTTDTNAATTSYSYSVKTEVTFPILKVSNTLTFSNSSTHSNRTGSNDSSSYTITLPSAPYNGPSTLYIYMDTIYKTFMFSFAR